MFRVLTRRGRSERHRRRPSLSSVWTEDSDMHLTREGKNSLGLGFGLLLSTGPEYVGIRV
eukprot:3341936-Rhodomonas_salina.3